MTWGYLIPEDMRYILRDAPVDVIRRHRQICSEIDHPTFAKIVEIIDELLAERDAS